MKHWRVVLTHRGKEAIFTLAARDQAAARAIVADWLIDRPDYRLVSLTDVTGVG